MRVPSSVERLSVGAPRVECIARERVSPWLGAPEKQKPAPKGVKQEKRGMTSPDRQRERVVRGDAAAVLRDDLHAGCGRLRDAGAPRARGADLAGPRGPRRGREDACDRRVIEGGVAGAVVDEQA